VDRERPAVPDAARHAVQRAGFCHPQDETGVAHRTVDHRRHLGRPLHRAICPQVVEFGPPNASIHKIDEHIEAADIDPLKNIYRRTLENLLA
jgi:acetylornithine deacetylase/succinyl-diaminopimelate desuccinylase-like protein